MELRDPEWLALAAETDGPGFARFQRELTRYNRHRLEPSLPYAAWRAHLRDEGRVAEAEGDFVEAVRQEIAPLVRDIPLDVDAFIAWFERLRETGPGQGDPLFPWLAAQASLEQMKWFIEQEVAGEAGFDDLLAFTQVKMPEQAKLEMARNFWDEMGRGASQGNARADAGALGAPCRRAAHPRDRDPRSLGTGKFDGGPCAQSPLRVSLDRGAGRHRDDGADARGLRRSRTCDASEFRRRNAITLPCMRCSTSGIPKPGIARSCARSSPRIRAARARSARARFSGYGTAPAASSAIGRNSTCLCSRMRPRRPRIDGKLTA